MYRLHENFGLTYGFATSLVTFTVEKYGGLKGFSKLANSLDETSDLKEAVPQSFGISYVTIMRNGRHDGRNSARPCNLTRLTRKLIS
jgi:hypothetical protein